MIKELNYSIIIPHHNIPDLLQRLLNSIPRRDDTEIIIIDDNSSNKFVNFNNFPGSDRSDVKLIFDKKGGFGGYARNLGLSEAQGKWLLFADADDYFNYCIQDVLNEYKDAKEDVIFFKANSVNSEYYTPTFRANHLNRLIDLFYRDRVNSELGLRYRFGEPWCKLIRHSIVKDNKIVFEERSIHNDTAFSYLVGFYAKEITVDKRALYCVTFRESSVSRDISDTKKLERIENFGSSSQFFKQHNISISETRHFEQLYRCSKENSFIFNKGVEILMSQGFSMSEINAGLRNVKRKNVLNKIKSSVKNVFWHLFSGHVVDETIVISKL